MHSVLSVVEGVWDVCSRSSVCVCAIMEGCPRKEQKWTSEQARVTRPVCLTMLWSSHSLLTGLWFMCNGFLYFQRISVIASMCACVGFLCYLSLGFSICSFVLSCSHQFAFILSNFDIF